MDERSQLDKLLGSNLNQILIRLNPQNLIVKSLKILIYKI